MFGKKDFNNKCLEAHEVTEELIDSLTRPYTIITDSAMKPTPKFDTLLRAINLFAQKGWRCVSISTHRPSDTFNMAYAILEKKG